MGINECDLRTKAGFGITVKDVMGLDAQELAEKILDIRNAYGRRRLSELGLYGCESESGEMRELYDMLSSSDVVMNSVDEMKRNAERYVTLCEELPGLLKSREQVIFESGQGLLLDSENEEFAPHVTASRTGLYNPCRILAECGLELSEAVYVTRSYVTRHGAGPLPYECAPAELGITSPDITNVHNPWQGSIRYARHGSFEEFVSPVREDLDESSSGNITASLFITHLNETDGKLMTACGDIPAEEFVSERVIGDTFSRFYKAYDRR
jgi:adenylosuccinate synthase